jgi:hypothetical protein
MSGKRRRVGKQDTKAPTKHKLPNHAPDVRPGLDEALEVGGEVLAAVEPVLEHRRDGVDDEEVVGCVMGRGVSSCSRKETGNGGGMGKGESGDGGRMGWIGGWIEDPATRSVGNEMNREETRANPPSKKNPIPAIPSSFASVPVNIHGCPPRPSRSTSCSSLRFGLPLPPFAEGEWEEGEGECEGLRSSAGVGWAIGVVVV